MNARKKFSVLAVLFAAAIACGPGEEEGETLDVSGDWTEDWSCEQSCTGLDTETLTGTVTMTLEQDGSDVTRTDSDGTVWTGTLTGNDLDLTTMDGDYTEDSTFTFNDAGTSFTVASTYSFTDCTGICTGTGEMQ